MTTPDADLAQVLERERLLLSAAVRSSRAQVDRLFDPAFQEIGASGRLWSRAAMLDALEQEDGDGPPITEVQMTARRLGGDLILVTYVSDRGPAGAGPPSGVGARTGGGSCTTRGRCCPEPRSPRAVAGTGGRGSRLGGRSAP